MRDAIANLVHPVLMSGLHLKDRLDRGEELDFKSEQSALKAKLLSDESRRSGEFCGEASDNSVFMSRSGSSSPTRRSAEQFLGIRYLLACWMDELFIVDAPPPWDDQWNNAKIEEAIYGTNERAWTFWDQSRLAESRAGADSLETAFLCVMLGFRGDLRNDPEKLRGWSENAKSRIAQTQGGEWNAPTGIDPSTNVPPLHGVERLQQMLKIAALFVLLVIPFLAFLVLRQMLGT